MLQFMRDLLQEGNELPKNTYHAKQIICPLGLDVEKIHACRNDCMLFCNSDADLEACRICGASQYKCNVDNIDRDDIGERSKDKRPPAKMV